MERGGRTCGSLRVLKVWFLNSAVPGETNTKPRAVAFESFGTVARQLEQSKDPGVLTTKDLSPFGSPIESQKSDALVESVMILQC
jgi:hypothetical protein